ncbi:MAG: hypothetical protein EZS28_054823, partial [Streblomastix strix]
MVLKIVIIVIHPVQWIIILVILVIQIMILKIVIIVIHPVKQIIILEILVIQIMVLKIVIIVIHPVQQIIIFVILVIQIMFFDYLNFPQKLDLNLIGDDDEATDSFSGDISM